MGYEDFESLKTFECEVEPIPWGGGLPGPANHMYGLRGKDHPAADWLRYEATPDYFERRNKSVERSWMNAEERRKQHSDKMKERWVSGKITADQARKNGNHGMKGKEIHNVIELEYKGKMYYGWRELKEATGVTKHLYKKYYLTGMDPESRIGKDGPAPQH